MIPSIRRSRSGFVAATLTLAVAAASMATAVTTAVAHSISGTGSTAPVSAGPTPSDHWLSLVNGKKHRQLFDSPAPAGGVPLVHMFEYYETLNRSYNAKDADIGAIGTFYASTTFYGLNDSMWAKYRLGEFLQTSDPVTGKPATANPWRSAPVILGMPFPQASIDSLQKRGATFLLCNNAITIFAGMVAKERGLDADSVRLDMLANILPGVELVPGMVVAIELAHNAGISYHRQ